MTKPKYTKYEDTMVEEFKEWKGKKDKNKEIKKFKFFLIHAFIREIAVFLACFPHFRANRPERIYLYFFEMT